MILNIDKYKTVNKKRVLIAAKGTKVNVIAHHDNVVIVEQNGERFSVRSSDLLDPSKL